MLTLLAVVVIGGLAVRVLRRRVDRGGVHEDYGFEIPNVCGGVKGFGALTPGDAMESARSFIEWYGEEEN